MSQRLNAAFNWPPDPVGAPAPLDANRDVIANDTCWPFSIRSSTTGKVASAFDPSVAIGVGHADNRAVVTRSCPFGDVPPPFVPSVARAVGHPAARAMPGSFSATRDESPPE
jgi:hypothetical protein